MKLLGLSLTDHDANLSYYDGSKIHYYKLERDSGVKHAVWTNMVDWRDTLRNVWGVDYREIDDIAVIISPGLYNLPLLKHDYYPYETIDTFPGRVVDRLDHYYAHYLSGELVYPADVHVSIDGCDDNDHYCWTVIRDGKVVERGLVQEHGSIGISINKMGQFLGLSGHRQDIPGKLMSLQSYGAVNGEFYKQLRQFDMYQVNDIFDYNRWISYNGCERVAALKGLDWATTVHKHVGNVIVDLFRKYVKPHERVCYTGGVAQNIIWNTQIKQEYPNLYIPPHCTDEGLSLGCLEHLRRKHNLEKFDTYEYPFMQSDEALEAPSADRIQEIASLLANGKSVAVYHGHGELGPRALGHRSILINPLLADAKERINAIKQRESFRPFGAAVLDDYKDEYFDQPFDDPYMHYTAVVKDKRLKCITHVDGTTRVQTVSKHSTFGKIIEEFRQLTGCAVLLNTSLNVHQQPIAGYTKQAIQLFNTTPLDVLVIGDRIYEKR